MYGNPCRCQKLLYLGLFLGLVEFLVLSRELTRKGNGSLNLESERYYRQMLLMTEIYAMFALGQ